MTPGDTTRLRRMWGGELVLEPGRAARHELSRVEARRLIVHPATIAGAVLTGVMVPALLADPDADLVEYKLAVGGALLYFAIGVMVAASLAASRSRRSGSDELFASMPVPPLARRTALLMALSPAILVALLLQAVVAAHVRSWDGLAAPVLPSGGGGRQAITVTPGAVAFLQGPALVALGGVLGVALARWTASVLPTFVMAGVAGYVLMPALLWWDWGWQRFLLPIAHDLHTAGTVELGDRSAVSVGGSTPQALAWHVAYLAGWVILLAGLILLGNRSRRRPFLLAAGGLITGGAAVMQAVEWRS